MNDKLVYIGLGNSLRGDDGIGWALTEKLVDKGYQGVQIRDDLTLLLDIFKKYESVIIIDAMQNPKEKLGFHQVLKLSTLFEINYQASTHSIGLKQCLELAEAMGCLPKNLSVYAINGNNFAMGDTLSPEIDINFHLNNLEELCTNPV